MARRRYYRDYRDENGGKKFFTGLAVFLLSAGLLFGATVLGAWQNAKVGKLVGKNFGTAQTQTSVTVAPNEKKAPMTFYRTYLRIASESPTESDKMYHWVTEYEVDEDFSRKIMSNENAEIFMFSYTDTDVVNAFAEKDTPRTGKNLFAEILKVRLVRNDMTEQEYLESLFKGNGGGTPQYDLALDGENNCILRTYSQVKFGSLNARKGLFPVVVEKTKDGYAVTEYGDFGDLDVADLRVTSSVSYLASDMLNRIQLYSGSFNVKAMETIRTIAKKACAEAEGLTEAEYTDISLKLDTSEPLTMKVGDEKPLSVAFPYDVDYKVSYWSEYGRANILGENYIGCYEIDTNGKIKALKAGTYKVCVIVFGYQNIFTLEVTK